MFNLRTRLQIFAGSFPLFSFVFSAFSFPPSNINSFSFSLSSSLFACWIFSSSSVQSLNYKGDKLCKIHVFFFGLVLYFLVRLYCSYKTFNKIHPFVFWKMIKNSSLSGQTSRFDFLWYCDLEPCLYHITLPFRLLDFSFTLFTLFHLDPLGGDRVPNLSLPRTDCVQVYSDAGIQNVFSPNRNPKRTRKSKKRQRVS